MVHVGIAVIALSLPTFWPAIRTIFGISPKYGFPLTFSLSYATLFFIFDRFIWRWVTGLIHIPDLNGTWEAKGKSSYIDPTTQRPFEYSMTVIIKQTFADIEIYTETSDSTSRSSMASISTKHAVPIFRYSFDNTPKNLSNAELQRHPGMMELRIHGKNELKGDYFSGKHRLRYGEIEMIRQPK